MGSICVTHTNRDPQSVRVAAEREKCAASHLQLVALQRQLHAWKAAHPDADDVPRWIWDLEDRIDIMSDLVEDHKFNILQELHYDELEM
jgi:hypothetical protein